MGGKMFDFLFMVLICLLALILLLDSIIKSWQYKSFSYGTASFLCGIAIALTVAGYWSGIALIVVAIFLRIIGSVMHKFMRKGPAEQVECSGDGKNRGGTETENIKRNSSLNITSNGRSAMYSINDHSELNSGSEKLFVDPSIQIQGKNDSERIMGEEEKTTDTSDERTIYQNIEKMVEELKNGNKALREQSAVSLGLTNNPQAIIPLLDALNDNEQSVRLAAARALGEIKDPNVFGPLTIALRDKDKHVRVAAVEALMRTRDRRAVEPLKSALFDKDKFVSEAVERAIRIIGLENNLH
jgi:uncharacterized membrane protein